MKKETLYICAVDEWIEWEGYRVPDLPEGIELFVHRYYSPERVKNGWEPSHFWTVTDGKSGYSVPVPGVHEKRKDAIDAAQAFVRRHHAEFFQIQAQAIARTGLSPKYQEATCQNS